MQPKRTDPYYQAQAILARRDHAENEVRRKLQRKGFSPEQIDAVVQQLKKENLIDDQRFVQAFITGTLAYKAVGHFWLRSKLRSRGVALTLIEEGLQEISDERWHEAATEAARSWRRRQSTDQSDRNKLMRFLAGRGFSRELSETAIQETSDSDEVA